MFNLVIWFMSINVSRRVRVKMTSQKNKTKSHFIYKVMLVILEETKYGRWREIQVQKDTTAKATNKLRYI